jgi:hypothetical protein
MLRDTSRPTFDHWLGSYGTWRENPLEFKISKGDIECEVLFRALDEPKDVRNLLSLELTGCYFNEVREIAKPIWEGMDGRVGRFPSMDYCPPTWWGIWADSNPWHTGSWQDKLFKSNPRGYRLFRQPSGLSPDAENVENLVPGYYEDLCVGKSQDYVDVYIHGLNGSADEGSVFGKWIERLRQRGGLEDFNHHTHDVFTCWTWGSRTAPQSSGGGLPRRAWRFWTGTKTRART